MTASTDAPITLEVAICDQRRSYFVAFATEGQAVDFIARRSLPAAKTDERPFGNHAFFEVEEAPIPATATRLLAELYPTCEHGMDAGLCSGPQHFAYDDEERVRYGI